MKFNRNSGFGVLTAESDYVNVDFCAVRIGGHFVALVDVHQSNSRTRFGGNTTTISSMEE